MPKDLRGVAAAIGADTRPPDEGPESSVSLSSFSLALGTNGDGVTMIGLKPNDEGAILAMDLDFAARLGLALLLAVREANGGDTPCDCPTCVAEAALTGAPIPMDL